MKFLNLDEISAPIRSIKLHGIEHPVKELDVDGFIETMRAAKEAELADETDVARQIELTIEQIKRSVPTLTREILGRLQFPQIRAINQFLQGQLSDDARASTDDEGTPEKKQG